MIKITSSDGKEFFIDREVAKGSGTIKTMLESQFYESKGEIQFQEIPGNILEKVIQYLYYKAQYTNSTSKVITNFEIPPEMALELLMASNYLEC